MPPVRPDYPTGCTDQEIELFIKDSASEVSRSRADINTVLRYTPLIQLGQNELQRRSIDQLKDITDRSAQTAKLTTWISIGIGIMSVFLTLVSAALTYQAYRLGLLANRIALQTERSSREWQNQQVPILREVSEKLTRVSDSLSSSASDQVRVLQEIRDQLLSTER